MDIKQQCTQHSFEVLSQPQFRVITYYVTSNIKCCIVTVHGKAVNFGDGDGMQVPCKLSFSGEERFTRILKRELLASNQIHAKAKQNNCVTF